MRIYLILIDNLGQGKLPEITSNLVFNHQVLFSGSFPGGYITRQGQNTVAKIDIQIIRLHAGKIRVGKEYTAPGAGTEIIINLPFIEERLGV